MKTGLGLEGCREVRWTYTSLVRLERGLEVSSVYLVGGDVDLEGVCFRGNVVELDADEWYV